MSQINWNEAPAGAQRYNNESKYPWLRCVDGIVEYYDGGRWCVYDRHGTSWNHWNHATRKPVDITTIDTPFGELDRETQLALVNHVLDGGSVEKYQFDKWSTRHTGAERGLLCFVPSFKYRAVPKAPDQLAEVRKIFNELGAAIDKLIHLR